MGHFLVLKHPFSARSVADVFTKEIIRLNGIPASIVSDRMPFFEVTFGKDYSRGRARA